MVMTDKVAMDLTDRDIERVLTEFPFFMEKVWVERELNLVAPLGRVEFDILEWMQWGPELRGVLALRGIGKTHFACGYMDWRLLNDPNHKCLIVSKSESEAKRSLYMTRRWISTTTFLKHLTPQARNEAAQRDSAIQFDVGPALEDRTPSCTAKGIDGQLEGGRAHTIIGDDVETGKNTKTLQARLDLDERVKQLSAILYPKGEIIYLGTYHHEESLYIKLQERGYAFRSWPITYPTKTDKIMNLAPMLKKDMKKGAKPGDMTLPHRFGPDHIAARKKEGRTHYAMQYMLIADLGDTLMYPLRLRDLIVFPTHRDKAPISIAWGMTDNSNVTTAMSEIASLGFGQDCFHRPIMFDEIWERYSRTIMWIDPSGRGEDKTGYAIVAELNGYLWVKAVGGLQGGYDDETLHTIASTAKTHDAREVYVEDNFGQGMFTSLLEPALARCFDEDTPSHSVVVGEQDEPRRPWRASIETRRVHGQKELRIIGYLEPVMNGHRLIFSPEVAANQDLQYQLTRITREPKCLEHEDELESLAQACWIFQDVMHQDPLISAQKRLGQYIQDELDEMRRAGGETVRGPNWINHTHELTKF